MVIHQMRLKSIYPLSAILILTGCISPWHIYKGLPKPDYSFSIGTIHGYDGYVWNCYEGKHIIVYRAASEYGVGRWQKEESPCNELVPFDKKTHVMPTDRKFHKEWRAKQQ